MSSHEGDTQSFVMGVFNVVITTFLLAKFPHYYFCWHLVKNVVLLVDRYCRWHKVKWHYQLMEFCYWCNYLSFGYIVICVAKASPYAAQSPLLQSLKVLDMYGPAIFRVGYTWSTGILTAAIVVFQNSLVFHSLDHMTILATHIGPPLVVWTLRWYGPLFQETWPDTFHTDCASADDCPGDLWDTLWLPFLCYLAVWALPYYIIIFIVKWDKLKVTGTGTKTVGGYQTLFSYYYTFLDKAVFMPYLPNVTSLRAKGAIYMAIHAAMSLSVMVVAHFAFHSFWLHSVWLMLAFAFCVWQGGSYYFFVCMNHRRWLVAQLPSELLEAGARPPWLQAHVSDAAAAKEAGRRERKAAAAAQENRSAAPDPDNSNIKRRSRRGRKDGHDEDQKAK